MPTPIYAAQAEAQGGAASNPYFQPAAAVPVVPVKTSPVLAFILGFIPGVGAIYNGQYLKGLVHALIFGLLVTLATNATSAGEPLIGVLVAAFVFYMPFEAYHTAKKQQLGIPVDEWSSILPANSRRGRLPLGPIVLIVIGVLYLLNSLDILNFHQLGRYWPVILIVIGAYMLYSRTAGPALPPVSQPPTAAPPSPGPVAENSQMMESRHDQ